MKHNAEYVGDQWFPETKSMVKYSKYMVTVYEVHRNTVEIEAYSPDHARERVDNKLVRGEIDMENTLQYDHTLPYDKWMVQDDKGNILS